MWTARTDSSFQKFVCEGGERSCYVVQERELVVGWLVVLRWERFEFIYRGNSLLCVCV